MSRKVSLPKIDERKAEHLLRQLRQMAPHYTTEWPAKDDDDPGVALLKVFSFIAEGVISRLNSAPDRNFLAFLDMLGIRLLQATPARVPVRFLLATGTEAPFLIPKGAQVTAAANAERPTELPFETIRNLWAIPAILTDLFTVDPEKDHIYKPPPEFLKLEKVEPDQPLLITTAFSGKDSKFLQLDPPGQLKKDDFLRIDHKNEDLPSSTGCPPPSIDAAELGAADHLVVADAKGPIITVTEPLPRDYVEGTIVRKVTDFELFEGKNWQEHVLYLGHADYFAIKSEAKLELVVEQAGSVVNLEALNVVWEFFGVTETLKEEGWHRFEVDTDGTLGFSRNGTIILNKPAGEIKEKEINGKKSRWIRARLDGTLPATPARLLPAIESLTFMVSSGGKQLAVDQAFHNDTPLTTDVEFFPFGTEPRIFDRFSIASEEAFSKPNAEIKLTFGLDTTELLASPAAVFAKNRIRVFAKAAAGKLLDFEINPASTSKVQPDKYPAPPDTQLSAASIPAVVTDVTENLIGVFAKADDGRIHRLTFGEPKWEAIQATPGTLQFDPAAILTPLGLWNLFVVADNRLYRRQIIPTDPGGAAQWDPFNDSPKIDSSPFALVVDGVAAVFVTDLEGKTQMSKGGWSILTPMSSGVPNQLYVAAKNARPFARTYMGGTEARVFVRNTKDQLVVMDTVAGGERFLGAPESGVGSNPFGSSFAGDNRIFVRGKSDDHLWSTVDEDDNTWTDHGTTNEIKLDGDPFVIAYPSATGEFVSTLSTSKKNALLEFRVSRKTLGSGSILFGPKSIIFLKEAPLPPEADYIHILSGPGSDSPNNVVRKIDKAKSSERFLVLESPLPDSPTTETTYNLLREIAHGIVQEADKTTVELENNGGDDVKAGDYLLIGNQIREIPSAPDAGDDTVSIDPQHPWDPIPVGGVGGDTYRLLRVDEETKGDAAAGSSAARAVLQEIVVPATYVDKFLRINAGPGESRVGRKIIQFFQATRNVVLASDFEQPPTSLSTYVITASNLPEAWFVHKDPDQEELRPELSWEYWNGRGWLALKIIDSTNDLLVEGTIVFRLPEDLAKTEVAGQENFWIRARIVGGDYGRELFTFDDVKKTVKIIKDPIRPPKITKLSLEYQLTEKKPPQICLTFNNLTYLDQTAANDTEDKHFKPYLTLADTNKAIYFGFDHSFESGPVGFYFAAKELQIDERDKPTLTWELASDNTWKQVSAIDGTEALTKPEFVNLTVPPGFQNSQQFGKAEYWLRATLTKGHWKDSPLFKGVFPNTVAAMQARTVRNEILGSSTAIENQKFRFQNAPVIGPEEVRGVRVIEGEEVRVLEFLTETEREELLKQKGQDTVLTITDQQGDVLQTWIRWTEVIEFFDSKPDSRHYRLDRHTGEIEFGDGVHGRIPPAGGDNIQAFAYQTGGGAAGNVKEGEITSAVTAVTGVESVINPVPAGGGSDAATNEEMLEIGPAQISHRDRAVTPEDFERLAHEASREVRKALCLPNRNAGGRHEVGWTSVHIVPASKDSKPVPSLELRKSVQRYLAARADVTLVDQDRIFVGPPRYVAVSVEVTAVAKSLDMVATAEQSVRHKLEAFLHPLTGGPTNEGWNFGRDLAASDLYALLEDIDSVDHVTTLRMVFGDTASDERVEVESDALLASGPHKIQMLFATENR